MVKNEESVIESTLKPFVEAGIDSFFVFDTGSTDNTVTVTKKFFSDNNIIHGYVEEEAFIDFATSRNHALERAQEIFPDAAFLLMFDAEWYIHNVQSLIDFCQLCLKCEDKYSSYLIRIVNGHEDFYIPRLIRNKSNVQFFGKVHENIISQTRVKVPRHIYFEYAPTVCGVKKTKKRYIQDRKILYKEHAKNPHDPRTLFYLAMTCQALEYLEEAYSLYMKRIALNGFDEEDFMAYYRLAQIIEKLSHDNKYYSWNEALYYYLQAYIMRPHRAEPLVRITQHYMSKKEMDKVYFYMYLAARIPYPYQDILFIEQEIYNTIFYKL